MCKDLGGKQRGEETCGREAAGSETRAEREESERFVEVRFWGLSEPCCFRNLEWALPATRDYVGPSALWSFGDCEPGPAQSTAPTLATIFRARWP